MTTYYRPQRDGRGYLFALILTPDAAKPSQSSENFGNGLSAGNGIAAMKAYMEEFYGNDVEMASPAKWQRELESRTFHSPEMLNNLEIVSRFHGIDVKEYIVYGAASRSLHASSVHIPDTIVMQQTDREQHECGYYTYIAVPESLDRETIERYELEFVSRPQPIEEQ